MFMTRNLIISALALFVLGACGKDNFQTTPQVKVKSLNGNLIPVGGGLVINLEATDKEGDLSEGELVYFPKLLNVRRLAPNIPDYTPVTQGIPKFPDNSKTDLELRLDRNFIYKDINARTGEDKNDTINIRIVVKDRAGNTSDTTTTETIVLLGQ